MKKKKQFALIFGLALTSFMTYGQGPTGNPPATNTNARAAAAWYRGGNDLVTNPNNIFGTASGFNSTIWHQTNGFNRMVMWNGGTTNTDGRIGIGNNLPAGFTPQARMHMHQTGGVVNLRFTTNTTGATGNDGLVIGIAPDGDAFFINNELNQNFSWFNQGGGAPGTLLGRMRLYDGGIGQATGRLALSNDLDTAFAPVDRLTLYENATTDMNAVRFQNNTTGVTNTDGYQSGIDNSNMTVFHRQFENRPIIWESPDRDGLFSTMHEWMRIENNDNASSQGYLGLNNPNPTFHIDVLTEERPGGELLYRNRVEGDLNAYYGVLNLAGTNNTTLVPAVMGKQSDLSPSSALTTIGSIDIAQDLGTNLNAASRFISARTYDPSAGQFSLQRINVIQNRRIFQWLNGVDVLMTMDATGFLGIGQENPGNRLEINSDFYNTAGTLFPVGTNPTFATVNGQTGIGGASTGFSGLRFTDLKLGSVPQSNPGTGVLSVDTNGDVILVDASTSGQFGQACGAPGNPGQLTANTEVPLNNFNLYFSGQNTIGNNSVAVGLPCTAVLPAKFNVLQKSIAPTIVGTIAGDFVNDDIAGSQGIVLTGIRAKSETVQNLPKVVNIGGEFLASGAYNNYGIKSRVSYSGNNVSNIGAVIFVDGASNQNIGIDLFSGGSNTNNTGVRSVSVSNNTTASNTAGVFISTSSYVSNIGVAGTAFTGGGDPASLTAENIGVGGIAQGGNFNYGGKFQANSVAPGSVSYGVYSSTLSNSSTPFPVGPEYAGYFDGHVYISGSYGPSDVNMKTNIQNYDSSLIIISQLAPKTFEFTDANYQGMHLPKGHQYGLIAQEVETILPSIISNNVHPASYDSLGVQITPSYNFKGVNYEAFIPILIGGIQEQQAIITSQDSVINNLNDRLTSLENCLSGILPLLCELSNSAIQQNDDATQEAMVKELKVELNNAQSIVLGQNVPNPFAEQTVIEYSIPVAVKQAQILFYNISGQLIKSVDIEEMGKGRLTVFANDLSSGTYTYTLVADGQIIATKKMVKTH